MGIGSLTKKKARRVIGIDSSTKSIAFAVFEDGKPLQCGEVTFVGKTVFERLLDAKNKVAALVAAGILRGDYVGVESTVMVRNHQTAIDMAYVLGAVLAELMVSNPEVHKFAPISWQSGIGNPNLTKTEKDQIINDYPGKSKAWYSDKGREIRKQRTLAIARNHFTIPDGSDNIGDAVGIALFIQKTLTRP